MEKPPLRGTLLSSIKKAQENVRPELRGTLAPKAGEKKVLLEAMGTAVSKEALPSIESLKSLEGKLVIQRDGGKKCEFLELRDSLTPGRMTVKLMGSDGMRYSLPAEEFLNAITAEGGAWRLLGEE